MIEVEVRGRFGQFIKATLKDLIGDEAVVTYSQRSSMERVPLANVRLPPPLTRDVQAGEEAEVLSVVSDLATSIHPVDANGARHESDLSQTDCESLFEDNRFQLSLAAWWPCRVHKVRDDMAVVKLQVTPHPESTPDEVNRCNQLSNITDIVNRDALRLSNHSVPSLIPSSIHRCVIEIPKDLSEYASDLSVHSDFLKHCGEPTSSHFDADACALVVLSTDENTIRNISLLEETHLKMLRQKWAITRTLRQTMRSIELNKGHGHASTSHSRTTLDWNIDPNHFVEKFYVPQHLMGLAIGAQGNNIRAVRELPGVVSVRLRDPMEGPKRSNEHPADMVTESGDATMIVVEAQSAEAAKSARAKLEFTELFLGVPRRYVGRLIGRRTNNILSIIKKSGVVQIHFDDHIKGPADDETVLNMESLNLNHSAASVPSPHMRRVFLQTGSTQNSSQASADDEFGGFILTGTRESVEKARLLINFQLDYIHDLEKMEAEKSALMRNLSHTAPDFNNGYPSRGRIDASGYVTDWSGSIPGRGMRGSRRPPRGRPYPTTSDPHTNISDTERPHEENGPGPYHANRRPPRDSRNVRGYDGDMRTRRQGGRGIRRNVTGNSEFDDDGTGGNGDVVDRRRGSQDSDTFGSTASHDEDDANENVTVTSRAMRQGDARSASDRTRRTNNDDSGYPTEVIPRSRVANNSRQQRGRERVSNGESRKDTRTVTKLPPPMPSGSGSVEQYS